MNDTMIAVIVLFAFTILSIIVVWKLYMKDWRRSITPGDWVRFNKPGEDDRYGEVIQVIDDTLTVCADGRNYVIHRKEARP